MEQLTININFKTTNIMKKITTLFVCAALCATAMMGQTVKVGSNAEGGTWDGPDALYHATQSVKTLQDDNSTEVWRDSIYISGTLTRPGLFQFGTWGKDRTFILVGEGMENTTIQSYTDAELSNYEADPDNNPLPAWKEAGAQSLAFYIAPSGGADLNANYKVEVQFHDLSIKNIWLPDQANGRAAIKMDANAVAEFHNVNISNCKNSGADGSVIMAAHSTALVLDNCIIENNEGRTGTALFFYTTHASRNSSVTISNTVIRDNESLGKGGGAVFWCPDASSSMNIQINNSTFYNNKNQDGASALEINGAGIDISLYNTTIAYNKGGHSGFACIWDAPNKITMINTLIYGSTGNSEESVNDFGISWIPDTTDPIFTPDPTNFTLFTSIIGNTDIDFTGLPTHATSYFNDWLNGWNMGLTDMISDNNEVIPAAGSVAIDNGTPFPPYTDGFYGTKPDIGAYENNPNLSSNSYEKNALDITLYPMPVQNTLTLGYEEVLDWQILSLTGQSILSGTGNNINVETLQAGIYVIIMSDANVTSYTTKKFIKQ
tara:strand:+ start:6361 stop:8001 length:1641 start_codon:yes stop_codon:yes gene_type:complete